MIILSITRLLTIVQSASRLALGSQTLALLLAGYNGVRKSLMKLLILSLVAVVFLASCSAVGPVFSGLAMEKNDEALVYIYRESRFNGGGIDVTFYNEGKFLGKVPNGSFIKFYVEPGTRLIHTGENFQSNGRGVGLKVALEANETYFFKWSRSSGGAGVYGTMMSVSLTESFQRIVPAIAVTELQPLREVIANDS